jgi:glycine reductase
MGDNYKIIHYLNQFFGQIGGEDSAYQEPIYKHGTVGPGTFLNSELKNAEIIGTIICGDNFAAENIHNLVSFVNQVIKKNEPDILIAGPAFNAGRYGLACANICKAIKKKFGIFCLTGLFIENPAVDLFRSEIDILKTKSSAAGMKEAIKNISSVVSNYRKDELNSDINQNLFFTKGKIKNILDNNIASYRAVNMLKSLLQGKETPTEIRFSHRFRQKKAKLEKKLSDSIIALVTDGGLIPEGNPERLETRGASKFIFCDVSNHEKLNKNKWSISHEGYDNQYVLENPNRLVPLDALRKLEKEGKIKGVYKYVVSTTGVATALSICEKMGREIGEKLKSKNVDAAILTST